MLMPWILMVGIAMLVIEFLMVVIASFSVMYTDNGATATTLLTSILNSNDCTPNTRIPLRDVIAIGIATGKTELSDPIVVEYNNAVDKSSPEHAFSIAYCLKNISKSMNVLATQLKYNFYVKYCDYSSGKCEVKTAYDSSPYIISSKVIESSKIALPDGRVATVFLEK